MGLTPGVASGVVQVGGEVVGPDAAGLSDLGDGLLDPSLWGTVEADVVGAIGGGWLYNLGDVASFTVSTGGSAGNGIDEAADLFYQYAAPVILSSWRAAQPYVQQYGLPLAAAAGQFEGQVVAPFVGGVVGRVEACRRACWRPAMSCTTARSRCWPRVRRGGRRCWGDSRTRRRCGRRSLAVPAGQANGAGLEYSVNAGLNAATFGLYGDAEAFLPAYAQAVATGSAAPLAAWAGGAAADVAMNPLAAGALEAAGASARASGRRGRPGRRRGWAK